MNVVSRIEPPAPAPTGTSRDSIVQLLGAVVLIVEMGCVAVAVAERSWVIFLVPHLASTLLLLSVVVAFDRRGRDSTGVQQLALLSFVAGPFGTAATILAAGGWHRNRPSDLWSWYDTIAPPEQAAVTLVDRIIDGRLVSDRSQLPRAFEGLLLDGTPTEKRAVLAHLALENEDLPHVLEIALRSPDQALRVQAAAVAAHLRDKARRRQRTAPLPGTPSSRLADGAA